MSGESQKPGLLRLFRKGLAKTRETFLGSLARVAAGRGRVDPELLENLEETLIGADLGVSLTMRLIGRIEEAEREIEIVLELSPAFFQAPYFDQARRLQHEP